jgi:hypothetical protein
MVYVKIENGYGGVFAKEEFHTGESVYDLSRGEIVTNPTRTSIQMHTNTHIEDEVGQYINHSCSPTCQISGLLVKAIRDINSGDEITFDYNSNEDTLASPFECACCQKMITGRKNE